ncbi:hypothetical protein [Hydrotalea sp.]|uniref:OmpP1/FadL family transporter n=1 Tax=Hydrotalea sp. TaxID=2881279 RepID=UPI00258436D7|nr:hypothetical protein [Hydrotalea sp.]
MKKLIPILCILVSQSLWAQTPEDALRTAWFTQNGSARNMAVGGVMASLGGDISAANVNPAGLGLYKTRELVLSPGFLMNNNKLNYRGTDSTAKKNAFMYGASGIVIGTPSRYSDSKFTSSAFSLSVNQLANYNNHIQYSGFNNMSSFTEQYLEELTRDRADTNAALSNYIFGSSLAFRTYLIDTLSGPNGSVAGYQSLVPISTGVIQSYDAVTRGGYNEIALGLAGNMADRLYIGGSLTVPIVSYQRDLTYSETDATNNPNNNFAYFTYHETFKSQGVGVGLKLGMLYKPKEFWRIGFALHTPQLISFNDQIRSSITANTESYAGLRTETSDKLNSGNPGTRQYSIVTPWRAIASASYVFREVANTHKQRAFVSADLEYVNYRGARFRAASNADQSSIDYYSQLNSTVKNYYKGNINARIGGELKFDPWMFRLGAAYYGSPYAASAVKANRIVTSGGVGYRNHGIFIDLTYVYTFVKDANFPYYLNDKPNTYAIQTGNLGNIVATIGFKF